MQVDTKNISWWEVALLFLLLLLGITTKWHSAQHSKEKNLANFSKISTRNTSTIIAASLYVKKCNVKRLKCVYFTWCLPVLLIIYYYFRKFDPPGVKHEVKNKRLPSTDFVVSCVTPWPSQSVYGTWDTRENLSICISLKRFGNWNDLGKRFHSPMFCTHFVSIIGVWSGISTTLWTIEHFDKTWPNVALYIYTSPLNRRKISV